MWNHGVHMQTKIFLSPWGGPLYYVRRLACCSLFISPWGWWRCKTWLPRYFDHTEETIVYHTRGWHAIYTIYIPMGLTKCNTQGVDVSYYWDFLTPWGRQSVPRKGLTRHLHYLHPHGVDENVTRMGLTRLPRYFWPHGGDNRVPCKGLTHHLHHLYPHGFDENVTPTGLTFVTSSYLTHAVDKVSHPRSRQALFVV